MKKKLLPLAMLAGLAGVASTAQAVYLNTDGLGETLVYPFYTVESGQNTYVNVTNTTDYYKAVKVRFLEGENSQEVLDFNLYLSPHDVWTGAIVPVGETGAKIITRDNSCTVPYIQRPDATGAGADGIEFRDFQYTAGTSPDPSDPSGSLQGDGGTQDLTRTREGYIEIIEMGAIIDTDMQEDIIHDSNGKPAGCDNIRANWLANGVTPSATSANFENPADVTGTGVWLADASVGFAEQADHDTLYRLGGLYGYGVLINPAEGSGSAYNAKALDQFFGAAQVDGVYNSQHTNPGTVLPSMGSAYTVAQIIDGNQVVDSLFADGWDAVSSVFMHDTLSNDFVLDMAVNADTDWVITMPTKRNYVNGAGAPVAPFTEAWAGGAACEVLSLEGWDREEAVTELTGDIDFSPRPPAAAGPDDFAICTEVNVLTFGDASAVHPSTRIRYGVPDLGFENGWARLDFSVDGGGATRQLVDDEAPGFETTFVGLPITGFAVQKFINGSMEGGTLANYAWLVEHSYTRDITVP
ncbi:hypothetical protein [Gilvimarinus polysaccharolyticus]|uniref:hypothetical protein n=1 Tax=Gilvimarinus polysaccharolyticus TaxID=863921 RepID=UPI0006732FAA|nr:hypothetical protein [Gilvimarinus polysaccharolyticus]